MTPDPATPPVRPLGALLRRRSLIALVLVGLMLAPSVVMFVITRQPSATYASIGALIGIVAVVAGGVGIGVRVAVVASLVAPLAIVAGLSPVTGAALMAIMTLVVGRLALFGLHRATMLVPILVTWPMLTPIPWIPSGLEDSVRTQMTASGLTVTEAVAKAQAGPTASSSATTSKVAEALIQQRMDSSYLLWVMAFFFIGAIVAVAVMALAVRRVTLPAPEPHSRSEVMPYTITITVLAAGATYYCLANPKLVAGSFLIATILVLTQVGNDFNWKLTIQRLLGTLGGVLLLAAITSVVGPASYTVVLGVPLPLSIYVVGLVLGVLAVIAKFSPRQWIYYVLIAPAAAMLNAFTTAQVTNFGDQRLADNVVGAALVLTAALVTLIASRVLSSRAPDVDPLSPVSATG